ncbi:conserved hypothetical protein [Leishmania major strain Friedlin]|uniref:Uncharacterized protein n=1 Tax=Leishmania major TaxID=5664 RepID=Q4QCT5_LEIMA|nr:conserved hypothetical protein [Leishmania major strain Friedlin]CAG9573182.1 hypothetical_protein_-_conserved [Leishmania major strain Friedlin]CAJ04124.1 conserved hypothetical protein [Leishmania major strain Friedlin]|eukprot:XP_001682863.1 conserved hypothetical protein [Leishmania major strain Friedlin]
MPSTAEGKSAAKAFDGNGNTTVERESLEATDEEETTNTYDEPQAGKRKSSESSSSSSNSSSTTMSGGSSVSRSETGSPTDTAGAQLTGGRGASGDGTVQVVMYAKRVTYSYKESQPFPNATTPSSITAAQEQCLPASANTSAAFPEGVSQLLEPVMPTPPRSNFVGGPGGPGRSGLRGAAAYTQLSPPPSAPQTTGGSALYSFSDSYAVPPSTAVNAPSFSTAYPNSTSAGAGYSAAYAPAQAPYHEFTGGLATRAAGPSAAVDPPRKNAEEVPARRKRRWGAVTDADENQPRRSRRIHIQDKAVEEDERSHEEYTGSSYSDEEGSYSYSGDEESYEYYEEFYEEEVEEDEEDEEEPRIDIIEGSGHGNTLHDILYGTPKAGANANENYSRDLRESVRSDSPYHTVTEDKQEPPRYGHLRPRHDSDEGEKEDRLRSTSAHSWEAATKVATAHRRSATPERVSRHHHHHKKSAKGYERTDGEDGENHHHSAAGAGKKHRKGVYEHGEPYTEGTFKAEGRRSKKDKAGGHYGPMADLDDIMEQSTADSGSESNEAPHEPAGKDSRAAFRPLSSSDTEDVDDFTAPSRSLSRNRKSRQLAKEVNKEDRRHHRSGAESMEATRITKLDAKDGGKVIREEEPINTPSQKRADAGDEALSATEHEDGGRSLDRDAKREDKKPKVGLLIRCACCSKEKNTDAKASEENKTKSKCCLFGKGRCCSKEKGSDAKAKEKEDKKPKRGLIITCICCSKEKSSDTEASGKENKTKSKCCLFKCRCCSKEKGSDAKAKEKEDKKPKRGLIMTCSCCSKEKGSDTKASGKENKGAILVNCACCSKKDSGAKDRKDKKPKGGSGGMFSCLFAMCSSTKSTKDQVADKKGKETDEEEEGAKPDATAPSKSLTTSPAESPVYHQSSSQQLNQKSDKVERAFKVSKSRQPKQQEEEEEVTAETSKPASSVSSAAMTGELEDHSEDSASFPPKNAKRGGTQALSDSARVAAAALSQGDSENEASAPVSKKASLQLTPRPSSRSAGQVHHRHSRTGSARAQRGTAAPFTGHSRFHRKPENPGVVIPVDESDEWSVSNSAKAQQQRRYRHRQTRVVEYRSKHRSEKSSRRNRAESSRADRAMLLNEKPRNRSSSSAGRKRSLSAS